MSLSGHRARLRAALLASSALIAAPAAAQDATWQANPTVPGPVFPSGAFDFNANANWTPAAVPTGTAFFGATTGPNISFSALATTLGSLQFNPGAPSYNFTLVDQGVAIFTPQSLTLTGAGIVNNSAAVAGFTLFGGGSVTFQNGTAADAHFSLQGEAENQLVFQNSSNAGTALITTPDTLHPGIVVFQNTSSAANSTITTAVTTGAVVGPNVQFLDSSTAGNATITNNPGNNLMFPGGGAETGFGVFNDTDPNDKPNAGTAHITNNDQSQTNFYAFSSAASATIVNNSGGSTGFRDNSLGGSANITNNAGGNVFVAEQANLQNVTITNKAGATVDFGFAGLYPIILDTATAGNATIINDGTVTFNSATTAGSATITTNNGASVFFNEGSTGGAAKFITNAGGTFDMSGLSNAGMTAGSIEGAGSYILGSKELKVGGNDLSTEVSGVISGLGGSLVKVGTGTLILSGTNTYTGGTKINDGTLQLGTLAAAGTILGDVTNKSIFNVVNANTAGITSITNKNGGETHFFNGTSASAAAIVNNGGFTTFHDMSVAGTADITNKNGGETAFMNSATAANATIANRDFSATSFFDTTTAANAVIKNNGGVTFFFEQSTAASADIDNRNFGATVFGASGGADTASAGNSTITNHPTGGSTVFFALTTAGAATIVNNGGATGFFDNSNAGTAHITNKNGGLILFGDNSSAAGAAIDNRDGCNCSPSLTVFTGASDAGTATITNWNFGGVFFVDDATAANATIVNNADGATAFGSQGDAPSAGNANITNNAGGLTIFQAFSTAANAIITTNGGGGTVFFDNANGGNAQFITNAGGVVDFSQTLGPAGDKKVTAGSIAGAGDYYLGSNQLTVGGNNLSTEVSGTINDSFSALAQSLSCGCSPLTPSSGASLVKVGTGTLTLSGINTYTGPTTVDGGKLVVNGSIVASSALTVNAGGTIGGNGMLPKTTIYGGTLSPGNSIGTINISGSLSFVGAGNYIVEVSPAAADKTNVSGAPGTASLSGTLSAIGLGGIYAVGTKYTVLNATGGVSGTFGNLAISGSFGLTKPHIEYDANNVYLVLGPGTLPLTGLTPNQSSVAAAVNTAVANGSQFGLFNPLFGLTATQLPGALDSLSGEVHATTVGMLLDESLYPRLAVLGRLRQAAYGGNAGMAPLGVGGPQAFSSGEDELAALAYGKSPIVTKAPRLAAPAAYDVTFWAQGFGAWGRFDGDGNAASVRRSLAGFFSGVDTRVGASGRVGLMAGYTGSSYALDRRGNANVETGHLAGYGGWNFGAFNLRGGAAAAWHTIDTSRTAAFPGFFDSLSAHYEGRTAQIFGEAGYGLVFGKLAVEPFAGAAWVQVKTDAANERGGAAALAVAGNSFDVGYSTLGIRAASMIPLANDMMLVPRVTVAWQHAFDDVTPDARLAFLGAPVPFTIAGVPIARDSLLGEAGLDLAIGRHATLGISYTGQLAGNVQDHAAKGKFTWKF